MADTITLTNDTLAHAHAAHAATRSDWCRLFGQIALALLIVAAWASISFSVYQGTKRPHWNGVMYIATEMGLYTTEITGRDARHQQAILDSFTNAVMVEARDGNYYCHPSRQFQSSAAPLLARFNCKVVKRVTVCDTDGQCTTSSVSD